MKANLGFTVQPGTLNILLTENSADKFRRLVESARGVKLESPGKFKPALLFKAEILGAPAAVVYPFVEGRGYRIIELASPVNLRSLFNLKDGTPVKIYIHLEE